MNRKCQYINLENFSCKLIENEKKMPQLTPECNCSDCLVALYRARGKL